MIQMEIMTTIMKIIMIRKIMMKIKATIIMVIIKIIKS